MDHSPRLMTPLQPYQYGRIPWRSSVRRQGFTLLEMVMVMFVLTLLLGAIFAVVRGTVQLSDELAIAQNKDARLHGFSRLCERLFGQLPADAMVRLRNQQNGHRYLYQLVLVNAPSPLGASGGAVTVLETAKNVDGYLQLYLRSMNAEQTLAWERGESQVGTRLLLLDQIADLEWRFYHPLSLQWEPLWNDAQALPLELIGIRDGQNRSLNPSPESGTPGVMINPAGAMRPVLVELRFSLGAEPMQRWVFWTPPLTASTHTGQP